jgi:hypothetical protein
MGRMAPRIALRGLLLGFVPALAAFACPLATAFACPDCATARLARASVLDHQFWHHLGLISLPIMLLAGIAALLYRIGLEP